MRHAVELGRRNGGLVLIEHKIITADAQDYTFASLDGNKDGVYKLIVMAKNGSTGNSTYAIQPNGATTNQQSSRYNTDGSADGLATQTDLQIGLVDSNCFGLMEVLFYARSNPNSVAVPRLVLTRYMFFVSGGGNRTGFHGGSWNDTSANVTSIKVTGNQTDSLKSGSELFLYKLPQ